MDAALSASPSEVDLCLQNLTLTVVSYVSSHEPSATAEAGSVAAALSSLSVKDTPSIPTLLQRLEHLRARIAEQPYSILLRLQVAELYRALGFPDLAAAEAYRALLLVDEVLDESGEYHDDALEEIQDEIASKPASCRIDLAQKHADRFPGVSQRLSSFNGSEERCDVEADEEEACLWAQTIWTDAAYAFVTGNLLACACLKSAHDFCSRGLKANPGNNHLLKFRDLLTQRLTHHFASRGFGLDDEDITPDDYPDRTSVRRELYPWNTSEPDRYSPGSLSLLNEQIGSIAPKLEARVTELPLLTPDVDSATGRDPSSESEPATIKQLGVFAREDVAPGERILDEKSLLTANARLHDSYCDACSAPLPDLRNGSEASQCAFCEDCDDIVFCSQDCHDLAQEAYHPALCGNDVEAIAKDAPAAEAADALYSLLLLRALAMAETQEVHPLELKELKYIWGDYHIPPPGTSIPLTPSPLGPAKDAFGGAPRTLPFSFSANVLTPLHMLEKMDVNIFTTSAKYDFWVFNTLYAKFRGTASARQGRDGKPDVGAVHPLWCLANHSCDPNVSWEWQGNMRFWVRSERVAWKGRKAQDDDSSERRSQPGLRKGDEILSHYCDVDLSVTDRREWAAGALGGMCMCERCVWEAARADNS
ncbi:mynd domain-containing protein [Diplodia corticola]|uniref:Mynd domain-containing protein n=1 Tax=Diplodia corticola TaxID=236234 RepID=A0A1J9R1E1_9PEZI|nr:mynd domain-containing protein [Diplodia corticola]OJD34440.1 mynd domain-containing protein [Diplodia corticola]